MNNRKGGLVDHFNESINLYTAFGIFNALMLFALGIKTEIGNFLAQNFMWLTVILWLIIRQRIPRKRSAVINLYRLIFDWVFVALFFFILLAKRNGISSVVLTALCAFIVAPTLHLLLLSKQKTRQYFVSYPQWGIPTIYIGCFFIIFMIITEIAHRMKSKIEGVTDQEFLTWIEIVVLLYHVFRIALARKHDMS